MVSRDPHERHRTATTLELLYDLTVVVAFSAAASQLAHLVVEGHVWQGIATFAFSMFAVVWAWISYSWFMSAYDTDDWFVRIATLVQMAGVCILTLGIPPLAHGLDDGWHLDNAVMVGGYVVTRLSMVALWVMVVATIGIPVLAFGAVFILSTVVLMPAGHLLHAGLAAITVVVLGAAFALAAAGVALPVCLVVLVLGPVVWVVAYELAGHAHVAQAMSELEGAH